MMRNTTIACALAALITAGSGAAQAPGAGYPQPGMGMQPPAPPGPPPAPSSVQGPGPRWGSQVGGHWWGGMNAPGGYGAYRAPVRGYRLPGYWVAPRFYVNDWSRYGFATPPRGYRWARYYDDAVLIDARGEVFDSVGAVDWDGRDARRGDGLGGAAIGAVVGGVAGNVVAGRGNRLAGTLIGAGVGAGAGYAIDRGDDGRRGPPPRGGEYREPMAGDYPPPPRGYDRQSDRPVSVHRGRSSWTSDDGSTTVVTTTGGGYSGGYVQDGGYAYGGGVTTVTVQSAPVVTTTTTTEVIADRVTYRPVYVHKARTTKWMRRRASCACGS